MPVVVYNRKRGLVNLEVICGQYFLPEFQIKWPEKLAEIGRASCRERV